MVLRPVTFLLLLGAFVPAWGADLAIGTYRVTLGMDQPTVMKELNARFHIVPVTGNPDTVFVSESKPPKVHVIGGVAFKNGRVSWIQRNWGSFSGKTNAFEVHKALFAALDQAANLSGSQASVTTKLQRVPGTEFKSIYFEFLDRKITLTTSDGDTKSVGQSITIDESISSK